MCTLRYYGDPVLRKKTRNVQDINEDTRALAQEMLAIIHERRGIGLAANQAGQTARLIVINLSAAGEEEGKAFILVNPRVVKSSGSHTDEEGCLSFPELRLLIPRAMEVQVEAQDLSGNPVVKKARGLLARVLQHEIDHLDGVLFIDRLPWLSRLTMLLKLPGLKRRYRQLRPPPRNHKQDADADAKETAE